MTATDVFSGWVEPHATLNNAHKWVFQALSDIRASVPLPVSEFQAQLHGDFGKAKAPGKVRARLSSAILEKQGPAHEVPADGCFSTG